VLLVASLAAASWSHRLHRNHRLLGFRMSLLGALVVLAAYSILSAYELVTLPYTASAHVYGSLVWTLSGYQLFHVLGLGCLAFGVFLVDVFAGSSSRPGDAALSVLLLYWKFVVIAALPSYATL